MFEFEIVLYSVSVKFLIMEMSLPNGVDVSQLVQHPVLAALPPFFLRASERYQVI